MKYYHDEFEISITGNKNGIIRMLNAAICNTGTGNVIMMDDDAETMNQKLGQSGLMVAIIDLIDEEGLKDSIVQEKKHDFEKKMAYYQDVRDGKVSFESQEEDEWATYKADEMLDNMSDGRVIELTGVIESNNGLDLEVSLKYDVGEELGYFSCPDWADWVDICRLYGRQVIVKDVQFLNGHFDEYCYFAIHKKTDDGNVNTTEFRPARSFDNYIEELRKIQEIDPLTTVDIIKDLEVNIKKLQAELSERKLMIAVNSIHETGGHLQVPEGVTMIDGITSGENGEDIKSIYIPASVRSISKRTISSSNIESIEISPENPSFCSVNNCILNKEKTKLLIGCKGSVIPAGIIEIEESAFSGCKGLKDIVIPGNVKTIGNHAFDWCRELESVEIGDGVQEIGGSAFCSCAALKDISIPDSVTTIYGGAFRRCSSLREIVIPENVTEYLLGTFEDCSSLEHVPFSGNITELGMNCFRGCTALTGMTIPEGVVKICYGAFADCTSLADVSIPESLSEIDGHAFDGCPCAEDLASRYPDLIRIEETEDDDEDDDDDRTAKNELIDENGHAVIPEGAVEIEEHAFECCRGLANIDIPGSVREIGFAAFFKCTGLTSIVIPEGVTAIEEFTFWGCTSLVSVSIPESIKEISSDAFEGCPCEDEILEKYKDIIN